MDHLLDLLHVHGLEVPAGILEPCKRANLGKGVAVLADVYQRVLRAQCLHDLLLLGGNHRKKLELILVGTMAERDVYLHVHLGVPVLGVDLHPLTPQAKHTWLVLVPDQQLEQALKQPLHAVLGKDAGDQFDALLRALHRGRNRSLGGGLEHVGIQSLRCRRNTRTLGANVIHVSNERHRSLPDERFSQWLHHSGGTDADDCARLVVHHVIHVHLPLDHYGAGVDDLGETVHRVAHDAGLD